jgi:hypothetical protein
MTAYEGYRRFPVLQHSLDRANRTFYFSGSDALARIPRLGDLRRHPLI